MLNFLQELKNLNTDRNDLETLVFYSALVSSYRAEFEKVNVEAPEWVDEAHRTLRREINARNADAVANRKKSLRVALDGLKTKEEKRAELEKELARLEAQGA